MSSEENKNIVRKYQEAYNTTNYDALDELVAAEVLTPNMISNIPRGLEGAKLVHQKTLTGMPDYHTAIEDLIAEGDKVAVRVRITGTHTGDFYGIHPLASTSTSQECTSCELLTAELWSIGAKKMA